MRQCLFSVVCFLSTCGLFASVPLDCASTEARAETEFTMVKKGGDEFDPAFGQAFLLLKDAASLPVQTPDSLSGYPFLVPLNTKGAAFEDLEFHRSTSSFKIKKSGKYCIDYFVKLFGLGSSPEDFAGQLDIAVKVNKHFVGEAKIAAEDLAFSPTSDQNFSALGVMSSSREIIIPLKKGDKVSLYLMSSPQETVVDDGTTLLPLPMTFGAPATGPDIVAYMALQKIS